MAWKKVRYQTSWKNVGHCRVFPSGGTCQRMDILRYIFVGVSLLFNDSAEVTKFATRDLNRSSGDNN